MFLLPLVSAAPAPWPTAMFWLPVLLLEGLVADGGVLGAGGVLLERVGAAGGVVSPVVLLKSAKAPLAVLWLPVVLW